MTDKVQKIRAEVKKLKDEAHSKRYANQFQSGIESACNQILSLIDSLQKKPKKCMYALDDFNDEDRKVTCDGCEEDCKYAKLNTMQEEPNITGINSKHATGKLKECIDSAKKAKLNTMLDDALSKETKENWNERLDKKDFRERYRRIAESEAFKKAHEGISIGDAISVEGEEPSITEIVDEHFWEMLGEESVSKVWHDATEKCVGDKDVLFHSAFDNRWYVLKVGQLNQNIVDKWAYIDELLKL